MGDQRPAARPTDAEIERIAKAIMRAVGRRGLPDDPHSDILSSTQEMAMEDEERVIAAATIEHLLADC